MSSEINEHLTVITTDNAVGIARAGFGTQGILSCNATFPERSRSYSRESEMVTDGMAVGSPEYRAAQVAFSQKPRPRAVKVLRAVGKPTLRYEIGIASVANTTAYSVDMVGSSIDDVSLTYTSDADATNDEIAGGLVALINAIVGKNFTASTSGVVGSLVVLVTGDAPGDWFSVEIKSLVLMSAECTHAVPATALATDLDAINNEDPDWYGLTLLYPSDACVKATAAWAEANGKLFVQAMSDSTLVTAIDGGGDTASDLKALLYARTALMYHQSPAAFAGAAWQGRVLPTDPGRATWKWKQLRGVVASSLTTTQRANARAKNLNAYTVVGDGGTTWEGTTADGDFIDVTRNIDWQDDDLQKSIIELFQSNDIIPMSDEGIALVQAEVEGSLERGTARGIWLGGDDAPVVTVPRAADVDSVDRGTRTLPDIDWLGQLAGAVHKGEVNGNVRV